MLAICCSVAYRGAWYRLDVGISFDERVGYLLDIIQAKGGLRGIKKLFI
jgi:hypothetical protein